MDDIWARVDEAIDTDPLQLRDIVADLLARAENAEADLDQTQRANQILEDQLAEVRGERDALRAAIEPVCERLDWLIANGFGARTADLEDLRAALSTPESPAAASTAVSAATDAHGGAGEAQEG